jgi:hypothetical protein
MKHAAVLLLLLLSPAFSLGWRDDTAHAVKGATRLRHSMRDPASFQVSQVIITSKGICIEYRSRNESGRTINGVAVYKPDKDLEYVDNSWIWQRDCLFGKLAQRRDGKDATEAVNAALKGQQASATQLVAPASVSTSPAARPVTPAVPAETTAQTAPARVVVLAPAEVAKVPAGQPVTHVAPVETPPQTAKAPVALRASAPMTQPRPVAGAVAPEDTGTARGGTTTGNNGELTPQAASESLGEVARRLRKEKEDKRKKEKKPKPV